MHAYRYITNVQDSRTMFNNKKSMVKRGNTKTLPGHVSAPSLFSPILHTHPVAINLEQVKVQRTYCCGCQWQPDFFCHFRR